MIIDEIRKLVAEEKIQLTHHFLQRLHQRNILLTDILEALGHSEIVMEYPDEKPSPCYLVLGSSKNHEVFHVVVGLSEVLWLITAYRPDKNIWSSDFKERKDG